MTSNIGTEESGKSIGFASGDVDNKKDYSGYLKRFFRPEFLNRLDEVITFNALSKENIDQILDLQLTELHERLGEQHLELLLTDDARQFIVEAGYDPVNGARPLRRAIERFITRPLSNQIVEESFEERHRIIVGVAEEGDALTFTPED